MGTLQEAMNKQGRALVIVIAIVCFILLSLLMLLSGDGGSQAYAKSQLMVVENAKAEVMPLKIQSKYNRQRIIYGRVESGMQSDIGFELSGVIADLLVEEGDNVSKGQALARLDQARLDAQQNELNAALKRAEADARLAALSTQRVADLVNAKLEPQQALDESQASLDATQALVNEVKARLDSLSVEQQKSVLRAPFDAQVVAQYTDEGTVLSTGQAVFSLLSVNHLEARFGLPENIAFGLRPGQNFMLRLGDTAFSAQVKSVSKQRNLSTRTIDTLFSIKQEDLSPQQLMALVSGDLVKISVDLELEGVGAWVPLNALSTGVRGLWTVFVYDSGSQTVAPRQVSVEQLSGERAYISGAIEDGDLIVVNGSHRFTPGQKVTQLSQLESSDVFAQASNSNVQSNAASRGSEQ